ncbi:right-handed parallel beta-helix repeat-containing protein [Flavihumibacter profundi]|uniref:right-handed parallel beta-helix repeat-containing protein n=1 Tax=Flavihumibacter profundi TaxID=2716883 RepID=UPI001CC6CB08|nr:right-handed parallel beta-helix repeat-containing protein [Flavihumibacter profundi]MBZ5858403.1 right-handed parallel beta-helix repeat-containing protein [Flavihumibacter profundi]
MKLLTLVLLGGISILSAPFVAHSQDTVLVSSFGLSPDSRINATPYIIKALEKCREVKKPVLVFPKGRYDFWPQYSFEKTYFESNTTDNNPKRLAILIGQFKQLTIDGNGSDFIMHDRIQPFTVEESDHITIKNLQVDWDIPLTAQAKILQVTPQYIDIQVNYVESPYIIENGKLVFVGEGWKSEWWGVMEFDSQTRLIAQGTGDQPCLGSNWDQYTAKAIAPGQVRLLYDFARKPKPGNILVLRHSERDHAGIFILESDHVTLDNLKIYHTAGLGVLSQYSSNLVMHSVLVGPNTAKGRFLSGHDDGFHYSNCKGTIVVDDCEFEGLMDDPINVHGTSVRIIKRINDQKLLCQFMEKQSVGMTWARTGEKVGFIENAGMTTIANGLVKTFTRLTNETFEVEFEASVPASITEGDALENLTWVPDVTITNSRFKSNRARGILVSTPGKVLIENNIFSSSGSAILIAGDANYWYETGGVRDVTIRGNDFQAPCLTSNYQFCEGIISIMPEIPKMDLKAPCYHRNIKITGNKFHPFDYPILYALSVDGLVFSNNTIERSNQFTPFHTRKSGLSFNACKNVEIGKNIIIGDVLGKNISIENMGSKEIKIKGETFFKMNNL